MFNHFATLLGNFNPLQELPPEEGFLLATDDDFLIIVSPTGEDILLEGYGGIPATYPYSALVNRRYLPITLPPSLANFRALLFPAHVSDYYRQFLLYYYLRIVGASDKSKDMLNYDTRVTYDLDQIQDYFRFTRISAPKSNDAAFRLLLRGALQPDENVQSFANTFTIAQIGNTRTVYVFSNTEKKYYKAGKTPSSNSTGMTVDLVLDTNIPNITSSVAVGDTGLSFNITGPFTDFTSTSNKFWSFTAEAPAEIDFALKIKELSTSYQALDDMFAFAKDQCNISYENMWHSHHNDIYRMAGLLLAYVERVNTVCLAT